MALDWQTPLSPDERKTIEDNMGLVWWEVRRARPRDWNEAQDWAQDAVFGLIKAIRTFDPQRGSWSTWAYWCIKRRLYRYRRCEGVIRLPLEIPEQSQHKAQGARSLVSIHEPAAREFVAREDRDLLIRLAVEDKDLPDDVLVGALRYLTPQEQTLLHMHYLDGLTYRQMAVHFGVSHQRVCQKIQKALKRLRSLYDWKKAI